MRVIFKTHVNAALELIELMSLAGWIAVGADVIWVLRDSFTNGFTPAMIIIAALLITAFLVLSLALWKYHKEQRKLQTKNLLKQKLDRLKYLKKHKRIDA